MKTDYVKPNIDVIMTCTKYNLLLGSPDGTDVRNDRNADGSKTVLSRRRRNQWDDFEEEDDEYELEGGY